MNFKKILSLFAGLNVIAFSSISVLGCGRDDNNQEKIDLKNMNIESEQKIKELQQQKSSLKEQVKNLKEKLQDKSKSLKFLQETANKITKELDKTKAELSEAQNKLEWMRVYTEGLQNDSFNLEQKNKDYEKRINVLKEELNKNRLQKI